jgi:hypothetical protein
MFGAEGGPLHMNPMIFISYRREDSSAAARWLWDAIRRTFGPASVFMDVEGIASGEEWEERIRSQLTAAKVVIVVIGPHWLRVTDRHGRRRIDRPTTGSDLRWPTGSRTMRS